MREAETVAYSSAIAEQARRDPGAPCLSVDGTVTTIGRLDRRANALAWTLHAGGVGPGDIVAIPLPNGEDFFAAAFAAWKLGATPLPLSIQLPEAERAAMLDVARPRAVVDLLPPGERAEPPVSPGVVSPMTKASGSGGSTGRPKIIVDNRPGVLIPGGLGFGYEDGPAMFVGGPVYHTAPFGHAVEGILRGRLVLMQRRFDAEGALAAISQHRAHFAALVPTMMHRIWRLAPEVRDQYDVTSLRYVWHTAAPCPAWLKRWWIDWVGATTLVEVYGSTEAIATTKIRGDEWLERPGSVGRPFFGETMVCDGEGRELGPRELGEIYMRAPQGAVPFSYLGEPERRQLPGGWESIGDLGWKDQDGFLYLADRRSDLIITGGENVFPAEVEAAIDRHPAVIASVVYGLRHDDRGEAVAATVQVDRDVTPGELQEFVRTQLVPYKVPRRIEVTRDPIRNDAGKMRRVGFRDRGSIAGADT
jgi:bile acid-coenzyme A ligase